MFHKFSGLACPFLFTCQLMDGVCRAQPSWEGKTYAALPSSSLPILPRSCLLAAAEVRLTTSGRTAKCVQLLSSQTRVPAKEEPQILAWNSLCPVLRQREATVSPCF